MENTTVFDFIVTQVFEEAGLEDMCDYKLKGEDLTLYSERSCLIEALNRVSPNSEYELMTLFQLEAECLRNKIYVNFIY